jgi:hypothetical protein
MTCRHAHWESEAAVADGMCPICLAAEIERLRAVLMQIAHGRRDNGRPLAAEMARQKAREALPEGSW